MISNTTDNMVMPVAPMCGTGNYNGNDCFGGFYFCFCSPAVGEMASVEVLAVMKV